MAHSLASVFIDLLWHSHAHRLHVVYGCFKAKTSELRQQNTDPAAHKAENISSLSIYRKCLLIPTLEG